MSESASNHGPIGEQYAAVEQIVYKNGQRHVYGVDAETGKKRHISHKEVMGWYDYEPERVPQPSFELPLEGVGASVIAAPDAHAEPVASETAAELDAETIWKILSDDVDLARAELEEDEGEFTVPPVTAPSFRAHLNAAFKELPEEEKALWRAPRGEQATEAVSPQPEPAAAAAEAASVVPAPATTEWKPRQATGVAIDAPTAAEQVAQADSELSDRQKEIRYGHRMLKDAIRRADELREAAQTDPMKVAEYHHALDSLLTRFDRLTVLERLDDEDIAEKTQQLLERYPEIVELQFDTPSDETEAQPAAVRVEAERTEHVWGPKDDRRVKAELTRLIVEARKARFSGNEPRIGISIGNMRLVLEGARMRGADPAFLEEVETRMAAALRMPKGRLRNEKKLVDRRTQAASESSKHPAAAEAVANSEDTQRMPAVGADRQPSAPSPERLRTVRRRKIGTAIGGAALTVWMLLNQGGSDRVAPANANAATTTTAVPAVSGQPAAAGEAAGTFSHKLQSGETIWDRIYADFARRGVAEPSLAKVKAAESRYLQLNGLDDNTATKLEVGRDIKVPPIDDLL